MVLEQKGVTEVEEHGTEKPDEKIYYRIQWEDGDTVFEDFNGELLIRLH